MRNATTTGLTRLQISSDLNVGLSTLTKWVQKHPLPDREHDDLMSGPDKDMERKNEGHRKEVRVLREEREVSEKAAILPPLSISLHQRYSRLGATPLRWATAEMLSPPFLVSWTIPSFSAAGQRQPRPPSAITLMSVIRTSLGLCSSLLGQAKGAGRNAGRFKNQ